MRVQRRRLGEHVYAVAVDRDGTPERAARTLQALTEGTGLVSDRTLESLAGPEAVLLAPTAPSKVVCIGLNYRRHAEEMNKPLPSSPLMFLKPSTAVVGPGQAIVRPPESELVHHEAELAVVLGRR